MIKSMTGHGRATAACSGKTVVAEIRSINSRYLDISCRLPKLYSRFEEKIKQEIGKYAVRGKVELYVGFENIAEDEDQLVTLNKPYLQSYLAALSELRREYKLKNDISVMSVAQNREIFLVTKAAKDDETLWAEICPALQQAFEDFVKMRAEEGEKMKQDILSKLCELEGVISKIKQEMPKVVSAYRERLAAKMREVLEDKDIDEARLITEVAIFADKVAVDEEMVRLDSHLSQFCSIIDKAEGEVGRKLDFLLQEINREINTTGSKATSAEVAMLVVEAKSIAEKIREQIQNIE